MTSRGWQTVAAPIPATAASTILVDNGIAAAVEVLVVVVGAGCVVFTPTDGEPIVVVVGRLIKLVIVARGFLLSSLPLLVVAEDDPLAGCWFIFGLTKCVVLLRYYAR